MSLTINQLSRVLKQQSLPNSPLLIYSLYYCHYGENNILRKVFTSSTSFRVLPLCVCRCVCVCVWSIQYVRKKHFLLAVHQIGEMVVTVRGQSTTQLLGRIYNSKHMMYLYCLTIKMANECSANSTFHCLVYYSYFIKMVFGMTSKEKL